MKLEWDAYHGDEISMNEWKIEVGRGCNSPRSATWLPEQQQQLERETKRG